jgi:hypothetical protein
MLFEVPRCPACLNKIRESARYAQESPTQWTRMPLQNPGPDLLASATGVQEHNFSAMSATLCQTMVNSLMREMCSSAIHLECRAVHRRPSENVRHSCYKENSNYSAQSPRVSDGHHRDLTAVRAPFAVEQTVRWLIKGRIRQGALQLLNAAAVRLWPFLQSVFWHRELQYVTLIQPLHASVLTLTPACVFVHSRLLHSRKREPEACCFLAGCGSGRDSISRKPLIEPTSSGATRLPFTAARIVATSASCTLWCA